ncbi:MAG: P1 family peptidase [Streptosporangiaceae bacterium]
MKIGDLPTGPGNAITDVTGVRVGHTTIIQGSGPMKVGTGPVRTGVTVIMPHEGNIWEEPVYAGCHTLNGNGELTGLEWVRESGMLTSPIALTNTHSVGVVRDALIASAVRQRGPGQLFWALPVVGETWDGILNDTNGFHVRPDHVDAAISAASDGAVAEGGVGAGTGMICFGFKGGIGTASRVLAEPDGAYTVGVLVLANYGRRERLCVKGVPVGQMISLKDAPLPEAPEMTRAHGHGSIIVVVATDAPLLPVQCRRLAQRAGLGVARCGGVGEHGSGDIFICFSTGNRGLTCNDLDPSVPLTTQVETVLNAHITPLFDAVVEATEESIVNALVSAETMTGRDGVIAHALGGHRLAESLT